MSALLTPLRSKISSLTPKAFKHRGGLGGRVTTLCAYHILKIFSGLSQWNAWLTLMYEPFTSHQCSREKLFFFFLQDFSRGVLLGRETHFYRARAGAFPSSTQVCFVSLVPPWVSSSSRRQRPRPQPLTSARCVAAKSACAHRIGPPLFSGYVAPCVSARLFPLRH